MWYRKRNISRHGQDNNRYLCWNAVKGAMNSTTLTAFQNLGCMSLANGLAMSVTAYFSLAACRNGVAITKSPKPHNSMTKSLGLTAGGNLATHGFAVSSKSCRIEFANGKPLRTCGMLTNAELL